MMRHTCLWHLAISLSDYTGNCLLPAILESKRMSATVYSSYQYFTITHTTKLKGFNKKICKFHVSFHFLFIHFSSYFFFNAFLPKITLGPWQGGGGGGVVGGMGGGGSFVDMATGPNSDVQWAKKWRSVGQKLTHAGLKSGARAKMRHWKVLVCPPSWSFFKLAVFDLNQNSMEWIIIINADSMKQSRIS